MAQLTKEMRQNSSKYNILTMSRCYLGEQFEFIDLPRQMFIIEEMERFMIKTFEAIF